MKTALFVFCVLCASAAYGQATVGGAALSSQPVVYSFSAHPERAAQRQLGRGEDLLENSNYVYAKGERPLWEFAPKSEPTAATAVPTDKPEIPLGDSARLLRNEHAAAKKGCVNVAD